MKYKYANRVLHTDVSPAEIVRVVSDKTLVIRPMDAVRDPEWKPEAHVGGFTANVSNNHEQRWIITSNPEHEELRIRLNNKGEWQCKDGQKYRLNDKPVRFHDYNF